MAYTMKVPDQWIKANANAAKLAPLYNIDMAVGLDCPNRPDDVMLVQWFINIWGGPWYSGGATHIGSVTHGAIYRGVTGLQHWLPKTNGLYDSIMTTWIMMFQMYNGIQLGKKPDGKISPTSALALPTQVNEILMLNVSQKAGLGHLTLASNPPSQLGPPLGIER